MLLVLIWLSVCCSLTLRGASADAPAATSEFAELFPVAIITYNRAAYLERTLRSLYRNMPDFRKHPVIVSQDGTDANVANVVAKFPQIFAHFQRTNRDFVPPLTNKERKLISYYHISHHYHFALKKVFSFAFDKVLIIEEDLEIAPDFFEYFNATYRALQTDASIYAISAYNDNSKPGLIDPNAHAALHRSDFFPGLGWLLTRKLFNELEPKWPRAFWDDWMREPEQRKGRHSIIPSLSRSHTFGKKGALPLDAAPAASTTITGFLRTRGTARKPGRFVPDNSPAQGRWFWNDVEAMAQTLGTEPLLIELDTEDPPPSATKFRPVGRDALQLPNNHVQYIVTWYGLTAALLFSLKTFIKP